jgi:uncharacterized repeat protein (TIGR03803 family)
VKGALYGTTITGGPYYGGVIFSVTTGGQENVLHRFGANQQDAAARGGGSSYVERTAKKLRAAKGSKHASGNGLVIFSWQ